MNLVRVFRWRMVLFLGLLMVSPVAAENLGEGPDVRAGDFPLDIATPPAPNFDPVPPAAFLDRISEIADWIVARSDYPPGIAPPVIVLMPRATLNRAAGTAGSCRWRFSAAPSVKITRRGYL
jgi:hypothetical protein